MATRIDYGLTPNDIHALAAVIATELGWKGKELGEKPIDARGKQNYYSQLEADAILDAMVLRQMISQGSNKLGSMKYNTLANVAMAPLQFSGLNEFSKSLYGNPDLTEDEYLAAIRSGLGSDISDELFNRAVANVNSYFKRRIAAGGNAIGPFKDNPNTHFINARIGNMAKTQDAWTDGSLRLMTPGENNFGEWILPKGFVMPNGEPLKEATLWYPSHNFLYNTRYNPRPKSETYPGDFNPLVTDPKTKKLAAYTNFDTGWLSDAKDTYGQRIIASPYNYSLIGSEAVIPPSGIATDVSNTNKALQELKSSESQQPAQQPYESYLDPRSLGLTTDDWGVPFPSSTASFKPGVISNPMLDTPVSPLPMSKKSWTDSRGRGPDNWEVPSFKNTIKKGAMSFIDRFNRKMRGEYSTGTPDVPPLYEMHGSDWGPQHQALLEKAISSSIERFGGPGKASNEEIINSIPDSIITDIRAQVNYMKKKEIEGLNQAGRAGRDIPPGPPPPPVQQYINDASQLQKPPLRIHSNVLENQRDRKEWERLFGEDGLYPLGTTPKAVAPSNIKTYPDQQMSSLDRRFHPSDDLAMGKFTENTDTVPAMLTEGEAVIPAESAQLEKNKGTILKLINEGNELQDDKEKLGISAFDDSYNEALAKLNEEENKNSVNKTSYLGILPPDHPLNKENKNYFLNIPDRDSLTPPGKPYEPKSKYDLGFVKRLGEWWEGVGEGAKSIAYPFGPGGFSNQNLNKASSEREIEPSEKEIEPSRWTDPKGPGPDNWEVPKVPWSDPKGPGPDTWSVPDYDIKKQEEVIESLPQDVELEQKMIDLDREELERVVTDAKKYTDTNAFKFKDVTDWIEENLGFNKQDVYRGLLYYVGGRLSGGSHAGSLRWAGRQVIQESGARNTALAKAQATAQGDLLKALTDEAKRKLKDGYFTREGSKAINAAIRSGNYTKLNTLLADTENSSLYNQMAMISDLSKRKQYYIKGTNFNNNMWMAPHKSENVFVWQDPTTKEIFKIPMDEVEEYKKDIDYDNMFNKFKNQYQGYVDNNDAENKDSNLNKLKRHYNVKDASTYRTQVESIALKYNKSPDAVWNMVTRLLQITDDGMSKEDLNVDLEAAIGSLIVQPDMMPDHHKLKDFNQKDINKVIDDFGGDPGVVTAQMQKVDEYLAGDPTKNRPQKLVKDIKHEEVDAEINNSNLDNKLKTKIKAIRNPYWKMVYLEFYTSRG